MQRCPWYFRYFVFRKVYFEFDYLLLEILHLLSRSMHNCIMGTIWTTSTYILQNMRRYAFISDLMRSYYMGTATTICALLFNICGRAHFTWNYISNALKADFSRNISNRLCIKKTTYAWNYNSIACQADFAENCM